MEANASGSAPLLRPAARADRLQARQAICTLAARVNVPAPGCCGGARAGFLLLLRQTSAGGDPPPCRKPLVNHQPSLFPSKLPDASSSTLHCCGNQNASLKFVPLILQRCCRRRAETRRCDRLLTDVWVADERTDCAEPDGCWRRGPLFKRAFTSQ